VSLRKRSSEKTLRMSVNNGDGPVGKRHDFRPAKIFLPTAILRCAGPP